MEGPDLNRGYDFWRIERSADAIITRWQNFVSDKYLRNSVFVPFTETEFRSSSGTAPSESALAANGQRYSLSSTKVNKFYRNTLQKELPTLQVFSGSLRFFHCLSNALEDELYEKYPFPQEMS